ncbi:U3 small nucleolar RNA-associated protein 14 [Zalerion maritima]|uniref:U3 small nucleolar RNA-associated protein 14 n=1 Tax=Zalerion maritima TaxID=339359 RepID=A0AAD5RPZ3_9PEZI|nr:U3 small nucleolar RNA-associated protein 14 [Zalerion maritima]
MARRQAHGRPLLRESGPKKSGSKKAKHSIRSTALNAFSIAADQVDGRGPRGPRTRQLDVEAEFHGKRRKPDSSDDEDEDDDDERPRKRIAREDDEGADDSDGLEWRVGVDEDDDSEIDSDDAFGESDEENLGITKNTSKGKGHKVEYSEGEDEDMEGVEQDDDTSSLGSEAIDLATALDQWQESESEQELENAAEDDESVSDGEESASAEEDESTSPSSDAGVFDEEYGYDDEDATDSAYNALHSVISDFQDGGKNGKERLDASDLGISTPKDAHMKTLKDLGLNSTKGGDVQKTVKKLKREDKRASKPGAGKKTDAPLPQRQQAKLDRSAAYEKTNETLDRWTETVKHNRRAEHLIFPLAQNSETHGVDRDAIAPITKATAANDLESTIMNIMEESGLGPSAPRETQALSNENLNKPSKSEMKERNAALRRERLLQSQEEARAKRIKKIKSKAYHRIHRKAEQRKQMKELEALEEAAGEDGKTMSLGEQELDDLNRQRAIVRMGGKHKDSKWAKKGAKAGRAVWDDEFKTSLKEMSRREIDLRRRIEGKGDSDSEVDSVGESYSESDADPGADPDAKRKQLLEEVELLRGEYPTTEDKLLRLPFMQRVEAKKRAENEALLKQISKELASDGEDKSSDDESVDIGRRSYGQPTKGEKSRPALAMEKINKPSAHAAASEDDEPLSASAAEGAEYGSAMTNGWEIAAKSARTSKKSKKGPKPQVAELGINAEVLTARPVGKTAVPLRQASRHQSQPKPNGPVGQGLEIDDTSSSDDSSEDESQADDEGVVSGFAAEKQALVRDEGDKVIDETIPGWGSWAGEGLSKREEKRTKERRFLKKVEGVVKEKARKDRGKEKVMINEKMIRKNGKYLASQLPHPFESREQYERSLHLPVGQEWVTKETFQDATKPRVIVKQGVIAPMSKPMYQASGTAAGGGGKKR